ncbi:MAG: glycosyltransferase family 2 protein [Syntrophales bacterium]|nr:glycosyltransferase family 2 protein [Syntrophales bacterium]
MTLVTVIVVNWNGKKLLRDCLEALQRQEYRHFRVILVDNGSCDGSVEFVHTYYPGVKTISLPDNVGFSAANNIAIRNADTRYVALLNNDAVPHPSWLKELVETLEANPGVGFAASKMLFHDRRHLIDRAGDGYTDAGVALMRGRGMTADGFNRCKPVFGACAGAALYRTGMLGDIGLFDEDFFLLYEDVDLSFRAQLRGYQCLYVPDAIVYHKVSRSVVRDSPVSVYYGHRNVEWVYVKNMPARLVARTIVPHIIYGWMAFLFFMMNGRTKEFVMAKLAVLRSIKGLLKKRREILKRKNVDDRYIWNLFEKERLLLRSINRLKNHT